MSYAGRAGAARTLTDAEQARLLKQTGATADSYRDHMLFSLALGTGLRIHELVALSVGDVTTTRGSPRQRVELRVFKRSSESPAPQFVVLPDALRKKVGHFLRWKKRRAQNLEECAPLFVARGGRQLSKRRAREVFEHWRHACDLSPRLTFHALRHTFCQNLYDKSGGNIRLVQKAARHLSIMTSTRYAEPSANELAAAVQDLRC